MEIFEPVDFAIEKAKSDNKILFTISHENFDYSNSISWHQFAYLKTTDENIFIENCVNWIRSNSDISDIELIDYCSKTIDFKSSYKNITIENYDSDTTLNFEQIQTKLWNELGRQKNLIKNNQKISKK